MRRDHETTTSTAAGVFENLNTPAIHADYPDLTECVGPTLDPDPAVDDWWRAHVMRHVELDKVLTEMTARWRPMRCAHGHCRTSLTDGTFVECPHGAKFCTGCTWEEACDECGAEAGVA